jgi:DNA-binding NarL/FixJ family response regulator
VIRVLLADDQALVRDGLKALIDREEDLRVVGEAVDGLDAIAGVRRHRPDVVLMDIRMPRLSGLEATKAVLQEPGPPRVLVLTTFDRNEWVYEALRAGASGFLLKDVRGPQLTDAIRTVAAGDSLLAPAITTRLIAQFVATSDDPAPPDLPPELTERETEVLRLVAQGCSNAEIADRLVIGQSTVKTHVSRLLVKLGIRDRTQAVVFAYEHRLVRPGNGRLGARPDRDGNG